jgi:hypothetical protein
MKKVISIFVCISLLAVLASTDSCKKDNKIKGCMDKDSQNYSATAQEDNGSCLYSGQMVFWYDQTASAGLIADGATSLTFSLNSNVVDTRVTSIYWTTAPLCGDNGSVSVTEDLGKVKTLAYTLSVKDQTGFEYWKTAVNFDANTCTQFQLVWGKKKK